MTIFLLFALLAPWCQASGVLPSASCTPGGVATADLRVICHTATTTRRHVTPATRAAVMQGYGVPRADWYLYELDHLVSLELGGDNTVANLWPEPWSDARRKDQVENALHRRVCSGAMTIEAAQARIARDWTTALETAAGGT